jgi:protein tyrosine phosphatase (PTP) superfamily phosphohydrolase (DUF442 family)
MNEFFKLFVLMTAAIAGFNATDLKPDEAKQSPAAAPTAAAAPKSGAALAPKLGAKPDPSTDPAGIHNLMQVSQRIYSGSEPHGEEGFESLAKLGVKTVVSVDGAKPNLEAAREHGIRYVHIPIGYDGVPEEAGQSLARAVKEVQAPVYVHCHHGKHRGPAAAAVACVAGGELSNKEAIGILERAGTSKDYKGLWRDVENFVPPPEGTELPLLVEYAKVDSFTAAMSQVDRSFDNLKVCRDAKWGVPPDQPDLDPAQEALLLQEALHESNRNLGDAYDEQLKTWLAQIEIEATNLRSDLQKKDSQAANERMILLEKSCKQCHQAYRDN